MGFGRPLYLGLGILCLGLGYVGYVVPGMPGTVFLLIALWAFKRSSPAFEDWMLNRSPFSGVLTDWERDRSMTLRSKIIAISTIWISIGASCAYYLSRPEPRLIPAGILLATAIALTGFLASLRTKLIQN